MFDWRNFEYEKFLVLRNLRNFGFGKCLGLEFDIT